VPHGDHVDYLVDGHLHHPHGDHCDDHGPVKLVSY
jgi:UDP-2,3-diacylglucosamine pyrophosphatase LpxH